ncbi:MAG: hypothetical protein M1829_003481 [Trizodia sp. TS-e1964]|nr:MAG: hypothetical protein M1829_003481 [Trizodia sp. TS-e1964]
MGYTTTLQGDSSNKNSLGQRPKSFKVASLASLSAAIFSTFDSKIARPLTSYIASQLRLTYSQLLPFVAPRPSFKLTESLLGVALLGLTLFGLALFVFSMSNWGGLGWGGRFSPFGTSKHPPQVREEDYSYITDQDLGKSENPFDALASKMSPRPSADDDILLLKHRGVTYPIHFPAYSIDNGSLSIGDVRAAAAKATETPDPRNIKMLYKGRILKDDDQLCLRAGLKIDSEVLCVISDGLLEAPVSGFAKPESGGEEDMSESEGEDSMQGSGTLPKKRKPRGKKGKRAKKRSEANSANTSQANLAPPGGASTGPSRTGSPSPYKGALEIMSDISSHFHRNIVPLCVQFTSNPPSDMGKRDHEHRKLSETIMQEVMLKLDAVETEGDPEARQRRKDLVKEAQVVLNGLDAAV